MYSKVSQFLTTCMDKHHGYCQPDDAVIGIFSSDDVDLDYLEPSKTLWNFQSVVGIYLFVEYVAIGMALI